MADPSLAVNVWTTGASSSILFTSNLNDADDAGLVKSEADHIISSSKSPKSNSSYRYVFSHKYCFAPPPTEKGPETDREFPALSCAVTELTTTLSEILALN